MKKLFTDTWAFMILFDFIIVLLLLFGMTSCNTNDNTVFIPTKTSINTNYILIAVVAIVFWLLWPSEKEMKDYQLKKTHKKSNQ